MEEIQPREKLKKIKMPTIIQEIAERILVIYLEIVNEIPEITDIVYAMENAIAEKMGIKKKKQPRKSTHGNGNRREQKNESRNEAIETEDSKSSNKLHRRKQKRKAIRKEKMILKEVKTQLKD